MPKASNLPNWCGEDAFVIGGGPSLTGFDFDRLIGLNTIGCNQAFMLGAERANICAFGDLRFWNHFYHEARKPRPRGNPARCLDHYDGWVVTNYKLAAPPPWLRFFIRVEFGMVNDGIGLGWNQNTGAMAVNLALMLGARRVFLLGMDMGQGEDQATHWHKWEIERTHPGNYPKFATGFQRVAADLPRVFPGRKVINVEARPGASRLGCFPKRLLDDVLDEVMEAV